MPMIYDGNGNVMPILVWGTVRTVAIGATSTQSVALSGTAKAVRLAATSDCYVAFGTNPTASNTSAYLPAGAVEYVALGFGQKLAVIQATAAGTLSVVEVE